MRQIETLDKDLRTINTWSVPSHITLDDAMKSQDKEKFRKAYFVSSRPIKS